MTDRRAEILAVCGGGRCGTSLVMQMLAAAGVPWLGTPVSGEDDRFRHHLDAIAQARGHAVKLLCPPLDPDNIPPAVAAERVAWIWLRRDASQQAESHGKWLAKVTGMPRPSRKHLGRVGNGLRRLNQRAPQRLQALAGHRLLVLDFEDLVDIQGRGGHRSAVAVARFAGLNSWGPATSKMLQCIRDRGPRGASCLSGFLEMDLMAEENDRGE